MLSPETAILDRLPGAFLLPSFKETARQLVQAALDEGFQWVEPTPLVDPFWHTTFTPSSSEIIFRLIEQSAATGTPIPAKVVTLQPCVRALDLAPWSDGRHLLHFHMVTYFWFEPGDLAEPLRWSLDAMRSMGAPVETSLFSYFQPPSLVVPEPRYSDLFGSPLLDELGVDGNRQMPNAGSATYHLNEHRDETGAGYEAWGPRIEVFADQAALGAEPLEYSTFVLQGVRTPKAPQREYFMLATAIGIERLSMAACEAPSYWMLPDPNKQASDLAASWGMMKAERLIAGQIHHILEMLVGLAAIAKDAPDISPSYKGINHQLRRLVRGLSASLKALGVSVTNPSDLDSVLSSYGSNAEAIGKIVRWVYEP